MKDVYENKKFIYIIMECVSSGELFEHIKNFEITEAEALTIIF
jgi:serine/threonine protein kinase